MISYEWLRADAVFAVHPQGAVEEEDFFAVGSKYPTPGPRSVVAAARTRASGAFRNPTFGSVPIRAVVSPGLGGAGATRGTAAEPGRLSAVAEEVSEADVTPSMMSTGSQSRAAKWW